MLLTRRLNSFSKWRAITIITLPTAACRRDYFHSVKFLSCPRKNLQPAYRGRPAILSYRLPFSLHSIQENTQGKQTGGLGGECKHLLVEPLCWVVVSPGVSNLVQPVWSDTVVGEVQCLMAWCCWRKALQTSRLLSQDNSLNHKTVASTTSTIVSHTRQSFHPQDGCFVYGSTILAQGLLHKCSLP